MRRVVIITQTDLVAVGEQVYRTYDIPDDEKILTMRVYEDNEIIYVHDLKEE